MLYRNDCLSLSLPVELNLKYLGFGVNALFCIPSLAGVTACLYENLTHWGRVMHICINNLTIIGSDNGLSPGWRQAIIWTNAVMLLIGTLVINFNEILMEIHIFSFRKINFKMLSGKWRPFCLGLNVLNLPLKTWKYACISNFYHFLSEKLGRWLKSFLLEDKNQFDLHNQCHDC